MFGPSFGDVRVPAGRFGSPTLPLSRYTGMFERGRANGDGELIRNLDDNPMMWLGFLGCPDTQSGSTIRTLLHAKINPKD